MNDTRIFARLTGGYAYIDLDALHRHASGLQGYLSSLQEAEQQGEADADPGEFVVGGAQIWDLTLEYLRNVRATSGSDGVVRAYGLAIRMGFYYLSGHYSARGELLSLEQYLMRHVLGVYLLTTSGRGVSESSIDYVKLCKLFKRTHEQGDYSAAGTALSYFFRQRHMMGFHAPLRNTLDGFETALYFNDDQDFRDFAEALCGNLEAGR